MAVVGQVRYPEDKLVLMGEVGMYQRKQRADASSPQNAIVVGLTVDNKPFKTHDGKFLEVLFTYDPVGEQLTPKDLAKEAIPALIELYQDNGYVFNKKLELESA